MNTTPDTTTAEPTGAATYSPEDNKLRLYIGRVPRPEYEKLKAEGWKALYKQREAGGGDFVATWTPQRRDTALAYSGGFIADEDMGPAERAADRAERFSGYRDKRTDEATGHADRYDAGPKAHGYQSEKRAERAAARHDRIADKAGDAWSRAEYWQRRTAGVISHALHKSSPGVRVGRIKEIEADLRSCEKSAAEYAAKWRKWEEIARLPEPDQTKVAEIFSGCGYELNSYTHPKTGRKGSLWDFLREDAPDRITGAEAAALYFARHISPDSPQWEETSVAAWINHHKLRLAYENQMIEAQGGRAAFVEMEVGGWIGNRQIRKVNKSNATGRVVSVTLKCKGSRYNSDAPGFCLIPYNIERLPSDAYRAPTPEDLAALAAEKDAEKASAPKKAPCPLINPTDKDAERLQELLNAHHPAYVGDTSPRTVSRCTQAAYSANSGGAYSRCETVEITGGGWLTSSSYMSDKRNRFPGVVKVRMHGRRVIVLTDKPQKPFPAALWDDPRPALKAYLIEHKAELLAVVRSGSSYDWTPEQKKLIVDADSVGLVDWRSMSQYALTDEGRRVLLDTVNA